MKTHKILSILSVVFFCGPMIASISHAQNSQGELEALSGWSEKKTKKGEAKSTGKRKKAKPITETEKLTNTIEAEIRDNERSIPAPKSQINFSYYKVEEKPAPKRTYEIQVSSWTPTSYSEASYVPTTSNFTASTIPKLSINTWSLESEPTDWLAAALKLGVSYGTLKRDGRLVSGGRESLYTQEMNLFSGRLGAEFVFNELGGSGIAPFASAQFLLSWAQASSSPLNDGFSKTFYSVEESIGLAWKLKSVASLVVTKSFALSLGAEASQGFSGSPIQGQGFLLGTRVEM